MKLTPNGLKKKSWLLSKLKKIRGDKKMLSKTFFNITTLRLNSISETQKSSVSEPDQFKNKENKNHKEPTTTIRDSRERKPNQKLFLKKKTSHHCDLYIPRIYWNIKFKKIFFFLWNKNKLLNSESIKTFLTLYFFISDFTNFMILWLARFEEIVQALQNNF